MHNARATPRVALIGTGLACALGNSVEACRRSLARGDVNITPLSIDWFADTLSMPWYAIRSERRLDSQTRFYQILESVVAEALNEAGLPAQEQRYMPVFLGSSSFEVGVSESRYSEALLKSQDTTYETYPIQISSIGHMLGHLRRKLALSGEDFTYGTACAASANALLGAARMLEQGYADHALVIGVELYNLTTLSGFHSLQLVSPDHMRPFDKRRNGLILGEACSAVVLSARAPGQALPVGGITLRGGASRSDTSSVTATNTDGRAVAEVVRHALDDAGVHASDIHAIKAHGTASTANDMAEAAGLQQVFTALPPLFALKPYTGHTLGACGVTELILASVALKQRSLPVTPGFEQIDPILSIEPVTQTATLPPKGNCLLNYFGFGGNNSVLVLAYA